MQNVVYGLVHLQELRKLLRHGILEAESDLLCEEPKTEYVLHIMKFVLDAVYVAMIVAYKEISIVSNFVVTIHIAIRSAFLVSNAWKLYREICERRKIRKKIRCMYFLYINLLITYSVVCRNMNSSGEKKAAVQFV